LYPHRSQWGCDPVIEMAELAALHGQFSGQRSALNLVLAKPNYVYMELCITAKHFVCSAVQMFVLVFVDFSFVFEFRFV
jgi:hypothetical protein